MTRPTVPIFILCLLAAVALPACTTFERAPYPAGWQALAPPPEAPAAGELTVLFATNRGRRLALRQPSDASAADPGLFGNVRDEMMTYGRCTVEVRPASSSRRAPELLYRVKPASNRVMIPLADPATSELGKAPAELFSDELAQRLRDCHGRDVYLYVHGYNNSLQEAAARVGALAYFGQQRQCIGVPVIFSWPAKQGDGQFVLDILGYFSDRDAAEMSVPRLRQLLRQIAAVPGVEKIHLIGHSTGAALIASAISQTRLTFPEELSDAQRLDMRAKTKVGQVVLASADIDVDVFAECFLAYGAQELSDRVTVYVSRVDPVLQFAQWMRLRWPRLGGMDLRKVADKSEKSQRVKLLSTIDLVDVSNVRRGDRHAYMLDSPQVSRDLILLLSGNGDVQRAKLLTDHQEESLRWRTLNEN